MALSGLSNLVPPEGSGTNQNWWSAAELSWKSQRNLVI